MSFLKRIKQNEKGVALFIVMAAMATLAIFVSEITYTAQINQKLAYDRLDQIKAHALAKSGLRLALLRIRAYTELKKTIGQLAKSAGVSADQASSVVPKAILEKIWSEPITIPFSGDISSLPSSIKDGLTKFRKDSGLEGQLYISIQAQSSRFNLNSTIANFASIAATTSPTPPAPNAPVVPPGATVTPTPLPGAPTSGTPSAYDTASARAALVEQLRDTFTKKFEDDEKFRDQYRSLRIEDLADEIIGWSDLTYDTLRAQQSSIPFKQAPFYHVSELHYLPSVDDNIYDLLAPQFMAGVASGINVNTITEDVLKGLVPQMTPDERKKFFDYRDSGIDNSNTSASSGGATDGSFKSADDFFKYLKTKVALLESDAAINNFKNGLTSRGITIITDESNFIIHIEATVQQTKKTLEANVSVLDSPATTSTTGGTAAVTPTPVPTPQGPIGPDTDTTERSNLKITQLRFL